MGGTYTMSYTPSTGDTITAARWITANAEHIAGNDFVGLGDYSASNAEMRTTTDPYPSGAESLPTAGTGELERLRYLLGQLGGKVNQSGYWYQDPLIAQTCFGRLTLTSATAVTTADVTAATTFYFTPYKGSAIALFSAAATGSGATWNLYTLSEISLAVPSTTSTMYDVWVYDNSGTLTLETTAWTNDTTRATAIAYNNGVPSKTGDLTRRYVGSIRTTGVSGQTEDSMAKRYVWNYHNRVPRVLQSAIYTADSWTYTTATLRQADANAGNQLDLIIGISEDLVSTTVIGSFSNTSGLIDAAIGIGVDSTSANVSRALLSKAGVAASQIATLIASWKGYPGVGRHYIAWLEYSEATGTTTWYGDAGNPSFRQSGIFGEMLG